MGVDPYAEELNQCETGGSLAEKRIDRRHRQGDLRGIPRGQTGSPKHLTRSVHDLYFELRGIPAANDLESFQCVHLSIQRTGTRPAIQGDVQAGVNS